MTNKTRPLKKWFARVVYSLVIMLLIIVGLGFWLKPESFDFSSPYHPFKSAQAKGEYLTLYDKRAKLWPVDSVVLKIKTTQGETLVRMSGHKNAEPLVYPNVFSDQELQGLAVPVFFLVGENEKVYSPNMALERLQKVAPHIQTQLVKGAGHDLSMAKAKQVNELILKFLSSDKLD